MSSKITLLILLLLSPFASKTNAQTADSMTISLLTCSPGKEIYALFGHSALRIQEPTKELDIVFNYGIFSFNTPHFIWRFVKGETDYQLGISDYQSFVASYQYRNSAVYEQQLLLSSSEKQALWNALETNYLPENRIYRYNFLFDNCATRLRDMVLANLNEEFFYKVEKEEPQSFRDIIHEYAKNSPWYSFGMDLGLGSGADKIATYEQQQFAPYYLMSGLAHVLIKEPQGALRQLTAPRTQLIFSEPEATESTLIPSPTLLFWLLFSVIAFITAWEVSRKKTLHWLNALFFALYGLVGCVVAFLVCFSVHPAVSPNYLLILFHPIHLLYLPFLVFKSRKRDTIDPYYIAIGILTLLFLGGWKLFPQYFSPAIIPLALLLLLRCSSYMYTKLTSPK